MIFLTSGTQNNDNDTAALTKKYYLFFSARPSADFTWLLSADSACTVAVCYYFIITCLFRLIKICFLLERSLNIACISWQGMPSFYLIVGIWQSTTNQRNKKRQTPLLYRTPVRKNKKVLCSAVDMLVTITNYIGIFHKISGGGRWLPFLHIEATTHRGRPLVVVADYESHEFPLHLPKGINFHNG